MFPSQSLPPSEEDQTLAIRGDCEEVLKEQCPPELTDVQEKDVRNTGGCHLSPPRFHPHCLATDNLVSFQIPPEQRGYIC